MPKPLNTDGSLVLEKLSAQGDELPPISVEAADVSEVVDEEKVLKRSLKKFVIDMITLAPAPVVVIRGQCECL